ncbi:hypothetical protein RCL_jg5835.t1 [Rhizophagus clarus]|uniref:Uncharacterized protein n=1 Tax=Rhizophagus clarus TaxID=94130 RepID=A0A8H3QVU4_9GLOM|nr:hypothetical protein RCL_jg5835.t1 [Rhizophagus clarus]
MDIDTLTLIQKKIQSASSLSELNSIIDYISSITNKQKKKIIETSIKNLKINTVIEFEECSKQHAINTHCDDCSDIWTETFGFGRFKRISKVDEEEVPSLSLDFIDKAKYYLSYNEKHLDEENLFVKQIDYTGDEFNNYEILRIKMILDIWIITWNNSPKYYESNYLFEYVLLPLKLFLGSELMNYNFEIGCLNLKVLNFSLCKCCDKVAGVLKFDRCLNSKFYDGKATLLMYDHYSVKIGRIRKANEIIIPVEEKKLEASFAIELFFQIKRRLQENFKIINEIECEIKKIKENNNIYATDAITYLKEVIKETLHTPKKKNL